MRFILVCMSEGIKNIWKEHAQRFDPKIDSYKLWMNLISYFYRKCSKQWVCWLPLLRKWLNLAKQLRHPGPQFLTGLEPPPFSGNPALFLGTLLFLKQIQKIIPPPPLPPDFWEPSWNTLKWGSYISYCTKLIENIIIITLYTFRRNSVFTTDSLVMYCL